MSYTLYLTDQEHQLFQNAPNGDAGLVALLGADAAKVLEGHFIRFESVGEHHDYTESTVDAQGVTHRTLKPILGRTVQTVPITAAESAAKSAAAVARAKTGK